MIERENLYFIAIIPPGKICDEITAFKNDFGNRFKSKAALKVMPHITLKAPFKLPAADHDDVLEWFDRLPVTVSPFEQLLENFGSFEHKNGPVVYVNPVMNTSLNDLQTEVLESFRKAFPSVIVMAPDFRYKPHITVAYRDLEPALFYEAWKEYETKKYSAAFYINDFHLLRHNGRKWNVVSTFRLKNHT